MLTRRVFAQTVTYVVKELLVGFSIFQLFFPEILNPSIILEIIPTKIALLTRIYANFLIDTKRIIYNYK